MKWLKVMSDTHRGRSMQFLLDAMGHKGLCYYFLIEMCAEKLEKNEQGVVTEKDCEFYFHSRVISSALRLSDANVSLLLRHCEDLGLCEARRNGSEIFIKMPMLLNLLERNYKKSTKSVPKYATKSPLDVDKDKEEDVYIEKSSRLSDDAHMKIFEVWNNSAKDLLPKCENISAKRISAAKARWKNKAWRDGFECAILKIYQSDFCCGLVDSKNSSGAWRASIDWFLKPDTVFKVNEGLYDNKKTITNLGIKK